MKTPEIPPVPARPLGKIAAFHCGNQEAHPTESLAACLADCAKNTDLTDCLIVTPEGFNIVRGYWGANRELDRSISPALTLLAVQYKVTFVSGLIEEPEIAPGHSSVYLIDGSERRLLSRKAGNDGSGNYTPCPDDWNRPIQHRGWCIGALICMDAGDFNSPPKERHNALLLRMAACEAGGSLLCIPARMQSYGSRAVADAWPSHLTIAVANGDLTQPSVIRPRAAIGSDPAPAWYGGASNALLIRSLA